MKKTLGLIPLRNFAKISDNIYRSAQPLHSYEYKWLKKMLNIGILVNLRSEADIDSRMAKSLGIKVINIRVEDKHPPTVKQAGKFIALIKKK